MNLGEDCFAFCMPCVALRLRVAVGQIGFDGANQFGDAAKAAVANHIAGEIGEEAFDKIQPGAPGRREVAVDAWMTVDPTADTFMLMSTVVVDNEVNGQRLGCFPVRSA